MYDNQVSIKFVLENFVESNSYITESLGIIPTKTWKKNDLKIKNSVIKYKTNGWELSIEKENVYQIDEFLDEMIELLRPHQNQIKSLTNVSKKILIIIYMKNVIPSIIYDIDKISFFDNIKITLEHDIYCLKQNQ